MRGASWNRTSDLIFIRVAGAHICALRPQTNGKVERFNRTLLDEWAYIRAYLIQRCSNPSP